MPGGRALRPGAASVGGPGELGADAQRVPAPGARRHGAHCSGVVEQRADAVPAPAEQPGEHQGKLAEHVVLAAPGRPHRHGRRTVEHQPHGELAVFGEHAKLRLVQPGGDVPVDMPRVVALGVFAQANEVGPGPPVRGPVTARQTSVEAAEDPPFQADQEPFRGGAHGHGQRPLRTTSGAATASSTFVMIASAVMSSASASYDSTMRCRSTSRASSPTSSGST